VSADVSQASIGEELSRALEEEVGQEVDVLVNCAGITHTATMVDTPNETYQVNLYF
jgi:short-subunit dehydrogenase